MSVKQRLTEFAKSQEKSVRAFEIKSGLTVGYINSIRVSIQPDKLQCIASHYPNLNAEWLLTGDGSMLKSPNANFTHELPPDRQGVVNMFTGMTDEEVQELILKEFKSHLLEMYETGRAIPQEILNRLLKDKNEEIEKKDEEILRLRQLLWKYESVELSMSNKPPHPFVSKK